MDNEATRLTRRANDPCTAQRGPIDPRTRLTQSDGHLPTYGPETDPAGLLAHVDHIVSRTCPAQLVVVATPMRQMHEADDEAACAISLRAAPEGEQLLRFGLTTCAATCW